jgi:hypothetical protein
MRKYLHLLLLVLFASLQIQATNAKTKGQHVVKGAIVDEMGQALVAAAVFLQKDHENEEISVSWEWGGNAYVEFFFTPSRTFSGYLTADFTGERRTALSNREPEYNVEAGLYCSLLQRRLTFSIAGFNLISSPYKGYSQRSNYSLSYNNRYAYPTLYVSVSYKFSNAKNSATNRRMSSEDAERRF